MLIVANYREKFQYDLFSAFSGGGQSGSGPMAGMAGMGLGALPMNPALVAAALLRQSSVFESKMGNCFTIKNGLPKDSVTNTKGRRFL